MHLLQLAAPDLFSDRGLKKNRNKAPSKDKHQDVGASSSGLTSVEGARSLLLPTTESTATEARRERESGAEREPDGPGETDTLLSTIDYLESIGLCVLQDDESWPFFDETCKFASNTAAFALVVNIDGIFRSTKSTHC